jgi:hypothetical protein
MPQSLQILPIPNFPDYFVSADGNVWSMKPKSKNTQRPINPRKLTPGIYKYRLVCLCRGKSRITKPVGRLVLETFIGPCPQSMEMCHGPNGKLDDSLQNLSWGTRSKNMGKDKLRDGTANRGEKSGLAKLSSQQVLRIKKLKGKVPQSLIANVYGVSTGAIHKIFYGKSWSWLR